MKKLEFTDDHAIWDDKAHVKTKVSPTVFYTTHDEGQTFWYFIWTGSQYRMIKYIKKKYRLYNCLPM